MKVLKTILILMGVFVASFALSYVLDVFFCWISDGSKPQSDSYLYYTAFSTVWCIIIGYKIWIQNNRNKAGNDENEQGGPAK